MKGRILGIKKTTVLRLSFILSMGLFLLLSTLSFVVMGANNDYVFYFCVFAGFHQLVKSGLFHLDSAFLFGGQMFFVGFFYFYCNWFNIMFIYPTFAVLAFSISFFFCHCFFKRENQFFLAIIFLLASIFTFIFQAKLISLAIFLALMGISVLLLIVRFLTLK